MTKRTLHHFHCPLPAQLSSRRAIANGPLVIALVLATAAGAGWWIFASRRAKTTGEAPILSEVKRDDYEHIVLEQGEIESSNNVEIRCEVKSRTGGSNPSTTIIEVIPEGEKVKKGDWLITFDSSSLETEQTAQSIAVKTAETLVIQAKAAYDTAVMTKKEYEDGTYQQERKTIENEIFVAEENLKKAELSYDSIKRSVSRGLVSELQLQGERFRVDAARKELELAKNKLDVLDNYTMPKMVTQYSSDIKAMKIQYENQEASFLEEKKKLEEIIDQISKCKVYAPQAGQVVYANVYSRRSSNEFVVEPGGAVREQQPIIRLPDPRNMQVTTNISETRINLVEEGQPAEIRVDALGEAVLRGEVVKVNKYAEPGNWWSSSGKEYKTLVRIIDPPPQLRTGLTAEVRIGIESRGGVLQVPVQAILERNGRTFALVHEGEAYETREVRIESTNDKVVALDESFAGGLEEHEHVVMNPRQHLDRFDFSAFPDLEKVKPNTQIAERVSDERRERADGADGQLEPPAERPAEAAAAQPSVES